MSDTLYKIRLLMVVRVVAVTTLLIVAFLVELWFHPARSLRPLYILTAATYVLTILYALLDSTLRRTRFEQSQRMRYLLDRLLRTLEGAASASMAKLRKNQNLIL